MAKLIMCVGIPGSGKSTWAAQQEDAIVVTRDDIREEYDCAGAGWSPEKEYYVVKEMERRIVEGLKAGKTVISADTNLSPRVEKKLRLLAFRNAAVFEKQIFFTDVELCIERDSKREGNKKVGEKVIRDYYEKFKEVVR